MYYFKIVFAALILAMSLTSTLEAKNNKNFDVGYQNSALIDNGRVYVAGYNRNNIFGDLITNEYQFVEYGSYSNAISVETDGYRIAVLTSDGHLTLQGTWIDGIKTLGTDIVDFGLSFQSILMLHKDGTLTEMILDRDQVNTITPIAFTDPIQLLESGFLNHAILTDNGDLYLDETFIDSNVELVELGRYNAIYKLFDGTVKVLDNITHETEVLISDSNIINVSTGDSQGVCLQGYVHFNDGRVFVKGCHNIIGVASYNISRELTEIPELFGIESIQSTGSHKFANIGNELYAWSQNNYGQLGFYTELVETHSLGYVTTLTPLEPITEDPVLEDEIECISHSNGKNEKGNQIDFCKHGFNNGKGHHK